MSEVLALVGHIAWDMLAASLSRDDNQVQLKKASLYREFSLTRNRTVFTEMISTIASLMSSFSLFIKILDIFRHEHELILC